ncbi:hypothetical protein [Actinacidiphila glaucinigra]|uniref:Uncharacterized protein n=1 Tax=Actinacidiphila glaucinigra TaxID=235986 RepID=A0A239MR09_9ACTN|nr:hypothetical protein [Actinacidiphila glaucinigra]SNT44572.1 hypothetical protein SAMN05216252_12633 [Actinacidiphila glaucinigra]
MPDSGLPVATARRLLASTTTCSFVEYRQFLLDAATLPGGKKVPTLRNTLWGKAAQAALTHVRAVQTPDSRTWTTE